MPVIIASRPNFYTGSPLDRATEKRDDDAFIGHALHDPRTLFVPVWRSRSLVRGAESPVPEAVYLTGALIRAAGRSPEDFPWGFLGMLAGTPMFTIDVSEVEEPLGILPADLCEFADLRTVAPGRMIPTEASILAYARGLTTWRSRHIFCGLCGATCEPHHAGHAMHCTNCKTPHFPRTDPAVIMLVWREDSILLGHSARFPKANMYSTLAGFVEPGESLEEAVRREVHEESAIVVGDVTYHSSQPWPFPSSIMLGFYGQALTEAITIDPKELVDARWFTRAQISDPDAHNISLPRLDSIARRLIEDWMAAG